MNKKILQTLEFAKIINLLTGQLVTADGLLEAEQLMPLTEKNKVETALLETADGLKVQRLRGGIPVPRLENIRPHMKRIEIGATLNGLELAQVGRVLKTTSELQRFFTDLQENEIDFNALYEWSDKLQPLPELSGNIRRSISEDGYVNDEASTALQSIRNQIRRMEQGIREQLDSLIRGKNAKYLSDTLITMRNDRYVIPVKQEYRGIFGGVVHDQSASGQTLFIEPKQVVEQNNKLRQAQIAERQEIDRILAELSNELAPYRHEIVNNAYCLGHLDFINGKARLAKEQEAIVPNVNSEQHIYLKNARHPLIAKEIVVANDIMLGQDFQAIVITGPNTGGKTITLKTLGLLQLMAQSGLAIPTDEESEVGIFTEIFADIGDEQSIEQSLSTFSSHMTNIVDIMSKIDQQSLVLFDELGAGTDPQEGAALAIAILDAVGATGAYVVATTHYPELKLYGYNRSQTVNASMEFDIDTLRPTYQLSIGIPGRSNAFEISKRLGLSDQIIAAARLLVDEESQDLNEMIADLETRRSMLETEYLEVRHYVDESEKLYHDLKQAYELFYTDRESELNKAKQAANKIIADAEEKADQVIRELRQKQKEIGNSAIKEHELIAAKSDLSNLRHDEQLLNNKVLQRAKKAKEFKAGDEVLVETYGQRGTLIKQSGKEWQVQVGILKLNVPETALVPVAPEKDQTWTQKNMTTVKRTNSSGVKSQLDLRGKRYEEALAEVDQYLDAAILAGYASVTIVHGKGTGALRQGITDYLKRHRNVERFEFAPANAGGNGATIVYFK